MKRRRITMWLRISEPFEVELSDAGPSEAEVDEAIKRSANAIWATLLPLIRDPEKTKRLLLSAAEEDRIDLEVENL